ncbi:MAG: type III PLP-dependent enzyme [Polyangiaceae bacterium]|nr:type III PLP-dependent enzyme [Polyangiaceae bacterium]
MTDLGWSALDATLREVHSRYGTPVYVYFTEALERRVAELRGAFGDRFSLSFAVKSNPNPGLLGWLRRHVDLVDVSSFGELELARRAGWEPARGSFTGPGKRAFEVQGAIASGIGEIVIESPREAALVAQLAEEAGRIQDVLVRVAPDRVPKGFGDHMAGRPVPFGIDVEDVDRLLPPILAMPTVRVVGLHVYSGTQCLRPEAVCENYEIFLDIFEHICDEHAIEPSKLVLGSGLGVPYHQGDTALDLAAVARRANPALDRLRGKARFSRTELVLELGRYLVAEAGVFLTQVVSLKRSRGSRIAICDGGMNNHLPASGNFGMVVHRPYTMHRVGGGSSLEPVDLVGPLCTSIDRLGKGVELPPLAEGDLVALHNSGAYGLTASPLHFISHPIPREVLVDGTDLVEVTRRLGDL